MDSLPEWGHDHGRRYELSLRCPTPGCERTWITAVLQSYGATDYQHPDCPECGAEGQPDE